MYVTLLTITSIIKGTSNRNLYFTKEPGNHHYNCTQISEFADLFTIMHTYYRIVMDHCRLWHRPVTNLFRTISNLGCKGVSVHGMTCGSATKAPFTPTGDVWRCTGDQQFSTHRQCIARRRQPSSAVVSRRERFVKLGDFFEMFKKIAKRRQPSPVNIASSSGCQRFANHRQAIPAGRQCVVNRSSVFLDLQR